VPKNKVARDTDCAPFPRVLFPAASNLSDLMRGPLTPAQRMRLSLAASIEQRAAVKQIHLPVALLAGAMKIVAGED
jgi:hypothetical protein